MSFTKQEGLFLQKFLYQEVKFRANQLAGQQRRLGNGGEGSDLDTLKRDVEERTWQLEVMKKLQELCAKRTH